MKICVVGAGPSGLTTVKQLRDEGHDVICFEKSDNIGGIWFRKAKTEADANEMKAFDNLILTISMKLMSYSDFMVEGDRVFYTRKQYYDYLQAYVEKFELLKNIKLKSQVKEIKKNSDSTWTITVSIDGQIIVHKCDAVAICSGPFQTPNYNGVTDIDKFTGEVVHSSAYRNNERFKGKKVLIVGLAESGADLAREISDVAAEATLSIRSYSYLLPRLVNTPFGVDTTDSITDRVSQYEFFVRSRKSKFPMGAIFGKNLITRTMFLTVTWIYGLIECFLSGSPKKGDKELTIENNQLGESMYPLKMDIGCEFTKENVEAMNEWNRRSHNNKGSWKQHIIFCKNVSFIPNIVKNKLSVNDSGIDKISGNRVFFKNNDFKDFDIIVLSTGFISNFSALGEDLAVKDNNVRNLYKHAFHPDHEGQLAFIGYVRPLSGGIPICAEMQARYFAQLCSQKLRLPTDVKQRIQKEKEWEDDRVLLSPRHPESIPSQIFFIDSIAKEIGCLMPFSHLIFRPKLLVRHWFYPFSQACYRLTGPHSMPEKAMMEMMSNKPGPVHNLFTRVLFFVLQLLPHSFHPKDLVLPGPKSKTEPAPVKEHFLSQ